MTGPFLFWILFLNNIINMLKKKFKNLFNSFFVEKRKNPPVFKSLKKEKSAFGFFHNPFEKERKDKRDRLLRAGRNPYPHFYEKKSGVSRIHKKFNSLKPGESHEDHIVCAGRVMRKRDMGKAAFFDIQDEEGKLQCYIKKPNSSEHDREKQSSAKEKEGTVSEKEAPQGEDSWEVWKLTDIGDIVGVEGRMFRTRRGELSLRIEKLTMLCKALRSLPEKYHGLEDPELRSRFRHWDLIMNSDSRKVFVTRSKILREIRSFMDGRGFMEVETPILQPIYGGAFAVPFQTRHRRLKRDLYLKISPELYLKKLLAGGFEKVYELGKNFRNEGIDRTHNPEFTMMEYYEAYTDYNAQMDRFEELICHVVQSVKGSLKFSYQNKELDFTRPWKRISVKEAVGIHGGMDVDRMDTLELANRLRSLGGELDSVNSLEKFLSSRNPSAVPQRGGKTFDRKAWIKFEEKSDNREQLERLRDEMIMEAFELTAEKRFWDPVFIIDFPIGVSPLTKRHRKWRENSKDQKYFRTVERFEPLVAGMELGNAYTELNDPVEQRERLELQRKERAHPVDKNFLHAVEVGIPPSGGVGLGVERLVMILTDRSILKDCILFPVLKTKEEDFHPD